MSTVETMDVNYSRWMSKDPDAEPDPIEDEPAHFRFPRPSRSVVASGTMVALIALGGAVVRSTATPEGSSTGEDQTVATTTAGEDSGPGAASVEDATDDSTSDTSTSDASTSDATTPDSPVVYESSTSDDEVASDDEGWVTRRAPAGPLPDRRRVLRRELGPPDRMQPRPPPRGRVLHIQMGAP